MSVFASPKKGWADSGRGYDADQLLPVVTPTPIRIWRFATWQPG
jgi:hypothetical protein